MKTIALICLLALLCGCVGLDPQTHAQNPPLPVASFNGRYLFRSEGWQSGRPFFEAGEIVADGQGKFTLHSLFNWDGQICELSAQGQVTGILGNLFLAQQSWNSLRGPCGSGLDTEAFVLTSDGRKAHMVSNETFATWEADLERDDH